MFRTTRYRLGYRKKREYLDDGYSSKSGIVVWLQRFVIVVLVIVLMVFLMLLGDVVHADENYQQLPQVNLQDVSEGSLLLKTGKPGMYQQVPILHSDVDMRISGMIVRARIKQSFRNPGQEWVEGIYVFPLPEQAAVDHMRMHIGDRVIEGVIKEKQEAKRIYEQARREGKKAALTEQERPNMFTNSVANIGPGETVVVEIEYQQVLRYDQGKFGLRFPMAITPRYIPGKPVSENISVTGTGWAKNTNQVPAASRITPPVYQGRGKINPVSLRIELDVGYPLLEVKSLYHRMAQRKHGVGQITLTLAEGDVPADRDFELVWTPDVGHAPKAALFSEKIKGEFYHLLMVLPPEQGAEGGQPMAREVIYIIDTSGSMSGTSIEQARRSLLMALSRLRPRDRFNVIQFNSTTDLLFSQAREANPRNLRRARRYVRQLDADGGTEMAPALTAALKGQGESQYVRQVIFLTDGSVGNESALFDLIKQHLGQSRLFTVGIGSAPNSYFMRKAAQYGRGTFTYIGDVREVNEKMAALFTKLESPVMSDLDVQFSNGVQVEAWPKRVPDLYHGEPIILAAKTSTAGEKVIIKGMRSLAPWQATLNMTQGRSGEGIGVFWGRSKIAALMDSVHEGADKTKVREEVINVALTHHLVSRYTSLVAVDVTPTRPQNASLDSHALPVNLPQGQNYQKIFGQLPQTATPAELHLLIGFMLLLLVWLIMHYRLFARITGEHDK